MTKATNEKILHSAQQLFWYQGHKGSSLDAIANDAGQSKGAVFHYFKNKNDITSQALHQYAEYRLFECLDRHFAATKNTKEALLNWGTEIYQNFADKKFTGGCLLANMALELSDQDDAVRSDMAKIFLNWENKMANHLKDQTRQGEPLMEPRQFARLLISTLQGITMMAKVHKDKNRAAREFLAFAELIERMVKD